MRKIIGLSLLCFLFSFSNAQKVGGDETVRAKDLLTVDLSEFNTVDNPHLAGEDIQDLATRNAYEMATIMSSQIQWDGGTDLYFRNSAMAVYVDGVKLRGSVSLPKKAIGDIRIVSGSGN